MSSKQINQITANWWSLTVSFNKDLIFENMFAVVRTLAPRSLRCTLCWVARMRENGVAVRKRCKFAKCVLVEIAPRISPAQPSLLFTPKEARFKITNWIWRVNFSSTTAHTSDPSRHICTLNLVAMVNYEHMGGMREVDPSVVAKLKLKLSDSSTTLPQKYRILFSLRNIAGPDAHEAMLLGKETYIFSSKIQTIHQFSKSSEVFAAILIFLLNMTCYRSQRWIRSLSSWSCLLPRPTSRSRRHSNAHANSAR